MGRPRHRKAKEHSQDHRECEAQGRGHRLQYLPPSRWTKHPPSANDHGGPAVFTEVETEAQKGDVT